MECLLTKFTGTPVKDRDIIVDYALLSELIILIINGNLNQVFM